MPRHRDPQNVRETGIDIGLACAGLMLFGIIAAVADPYQVAAAFLVIQTLFPDGVQAHIDPLDCVRGKGSYEEPK